MNGYQGGVSAPSYNTGGGGSFDLGSISGIGAGGSAALYSAGIISGGTAFLITGLVQLAAGVIGAFTAREPKRQITFEEKRWNDIVGAYRDLSDRVDTARAIMVAMNPGSNIEDFTGSENTQYMMTKLRERGFNLSSMNNFSVSDTGAINRIGQGGGATTPMPERHAGAIKYPGYDITLNRSMPNQVDEEEET